MPTTERNMPYKNKVIPKGKVFVVSKGAYSDYTNIALCHALKDLNMQELEQEYLAEYTEQAEEYQLCESNVVLWMTLKGYVAELDFHEMHLGPYGCADFLAVPKKWTIE